MLRRRLPVSGSKKYASAAPIAAPKANSRFISPPRLLSDLYPGAARTNEGSGLLDDGDVALDFDGMLPVHGRVSRDDGVALVDLAHVAELLHRELNGAPEAGWRHSQRINRVM